MLLHSEKSHARFCLNPRLYKIGIFLHPWKSHAIKWFNSKETNFSSTSLPTCAYFAFWISLKHDGENPRSLNYFLMSRSYTGGDLGCRVDSCWGGGLFFNIFWRWFNSLHYPQLYITLVYKATLPFTLTYKNLSFNLVWTQIVCFKGISVFFWLFC